MKKIPMTAHQKTWELLIIPCSGESYLGRLTRSAGGEAAKAENVLVAREDALDHKELIRNKIEDSDRCITVDGCEKQCMSNRLKNWQSKTEFHLVLTDMGIEQQDQGHPLPEDLELARDAILAASTRVSAHHPAIPGCCCG